MNDHDQEQNGAADAVAGNAGTAAGTPAAGAGGRRGLRKTREGEVVSAAMNKTVVVQAVARVPHRQFGKIVKQYKKFYVHDEENKAQVGDRVVIAETRPLSKMKRWRLVAVLGR